VEYRKARYVLKKKLLLVIFSGFLLSLLTFSTAQAGTFPPNRDPSLDPFPEDSSSTGIALNPLTGLPVQDPASLLKPPSMISITNWPVSARPQAGLSYVSMVFEFSIGDGESRFFSLFYGDLPPEEQVVTDSTGTNTVNTVVGPLRSGRLFYQDLRELYHGNLYMASAYKGVRDNLNRYNIFYGSDEDIISAFVEVKELKKVANESDLKVDPEGMAVNVFDPNPPSGGGKGMDLWFIYNAQDQAHWKYDPLQESYIRYQDLGDGQTFVAASDRINKETLTFENVIILYANHRYCTEYAFDVDFQYQDLQPAVLFRDGQMYEIYWSTKNTEYEKTTGTIRPIRFVYKDGTPFPLKPGQTWMHLVPISTPYWEAPVAEDLWTLLNKKEEGSGNWVARFYSSMMVFDQAVCDAIGYKK
jgi:hypothetical protein